MPAEAVEEVPGGRGGGANAYGSMHQLGGPRGMLP